MSLLETTALNTTVRFADGFDRPDTIAFGLEAPQLAVVVGGVLLSWAVLRAPLPGPLGDGVAALVALLAAVLGAGRWAGRPLLTWAWIATRFWLSPRRGGVVLLAEATGGGAPENGSGGGSDTGGGPAAKGGGDAGDKPGRDPDREEPAWARWLREGRARTRSDAPSGESAPSEGGGLLPLEPADSDAEPPAPSPDSPPTDTPALTAVEMWLAALGDGGSVDRSPRPDCAVVAPVPRVERSAPHSQPLSARPTESAAPTFGALVRRFVTRLRGTPELGPMSSDATARPAALGHAAAEPLQPSPAPDDASPRGRTVELDRPALVLLPAPDAPANQQPENTDAEAHSHGDEQPSLASVIPLVTRRDDGLDEELMLELGEGEGTTAVTERDSDHAAPAGDGDDTAARGDGPRTPVFVGATRRITFFSLNGGSGRTTLATEVACLLAARGRHRADPDGPSRRLHVALVDLDLRSSTTAVRLGVARPTLWDYLLATGDDADVRRFLIEHPSGLRALLGPPKPLSTTAAGVEPARIAEIVYQLERDGCHFILFDVGSDLGAVSTWVLSQVHDIYVVITPTGSGLQDAYRTTEALRRLGLGHKLRYVVNRARGGVDVDEVMGDLGGRVVASIPYDQRLEDAENTHTIASLRGGGPASDAIQRLARTIYPSLDGRGGRRGLWRRRAG